MTLRIDRRLLLKAGTLGLGALACPGAAQLLGARGFTHNVASGEPGPDRVMLWTRYVPAAGASARLAWQVSESEDFARIVAEGTATAEAEHDHIVKPVAEGLRPGRTYHYRFRDISGALSPAGRTRTLPDGPVLRFTIGIFSCSNLGFGWFNAYAHAAARQDLDLILHLGDYLYEYQPGRYPAAAEALAGRTALPANEIVTLADYRMRYAAYRADPDLQRLHQMFPMVMMWDDHESANNSWQGGAENHQPEREGDWAARKAAAMRACREWLPVSDEAYESYEIGDLATLFRPETRLTGRSRQATLGEILAGGGDLAAALVRFRDGPWRDSARTMLGPAQEQWLAEGLRASVGSGKRWQVLGQQVMMGNFLMPAEASGWAAQATSPELRREIGAGLAAARAGLPFNLDTWDGYPAARERLLRSALDADANLIVLTGDSHNAWAFDLSLGGAAAGVEMAGQSVTSPGHESDLPWIAPAELARASIARNPQLKWCDTSRRGYLTLELTSERTTGEWLFLDTVRERSTRLAGRHAMTVARGANRLG